MTVGGDAVCSGVVGGDYDGDGDWIGGKGWNSNNVNGIIVSNYEDNRYYECDDCDGSGGESGSGRTLCFQCGGDCLC